MCELEVNFGCEYNADTPTENFPPNVYSEAYCHLLRFDMRINFRFRRAMKIDNKQVTYVHLYNSNSFLHS